jgi:hypothetical protein
LSNIGKTGRRQPYLRASRLGLRLGLSLVKISTLTLSITLTLILILTLALTLTLTLTIPRGFRAGDLSGQGGYGH